MKLDATNRLTEIEALTWLNENGISICMRTLRDMRARKQIGFYKLPRGRFRIRFSREQLADAFTGREIHRAPSRSEASRGERKPRDRGVTANDRLRELSERH